MLKEPAIRNIDKLFDLYSGSHQDPANRVIHWICIPFTTFGLLGLVWSIPFPHLEFLGKYNGFINWASFLIALSIYYYYRLSPVLSYGMLLIVFGFSALIVSLEKLEANSGWPQVWEICLGVFILALAGQIIGHKIEGRRTSLATELKFLIDGPFWLMHFLFKKAGIRY